MQKRTWAARLLLLLVFLPILMFSSLHIHESVAYEGECYECANHLHHSGHISLQTASFHDCVLCQFVTLSFVVAVLVTLPTVLQARSFIINNPTTNYLFSICRHHIPRAPPVI